MFLGFCPKLAAEVYAAGDAFLIPSRAEPCGLIDLIAQLNGNVPLVNQVGGLSKVIDGHTGIGYFALNDRENLRGLVTAMHKFLDLHRDPGKLDRIRRAANNHVRDRHNWDVAFPRYEELYVA